MCGQDVTTPLNKKYLNIMVLIDYGVNGVNCNLKFSETEFLI